MNRFCVIFFLWVFLSCSSDKIGIENTLEQYVKNEEVILDNVISCAASNEDENLVSVFLYPRNGISNIQYFETENALVDKDNFENYTLVEQELLDVFNGYLKKFDVMITAEKWVIVTFEEEGEINISNPIRLKQISKPTEFLPQNITVDNTLSMPAFSWRDGLYDDTKIYFQVISDVQNNLLSGTYTYEKMFTYYDLDNVVLNITRNTPPDLVNDDPYRFTLMGVSEDNWVNQFSIIDFKLK